MKNIFFLAVLIICVIKLSGQSGITFSVENVEKDTTLLETKSYSDILKKFSDSLLVINKFDYELVNYGAHSFLEGMHQAYADHRPFVISPDMIWLLICQGFSNHINFHSSELRNLIVDFSDKKTLQVKHLYDINEKEEKKWEKIFCDFAVQIEKNVGAKLANFFVDSFSTTTINEKVAFQITLMDAMESYFEYKVYHVICGIPEITLLGTTADWEKIYTKVKLLSEYKLKWWVKDLLPILDEFIATSQGKINKRFWRNMFKVHTIKSYGNPKYIDGWILKFFPYDKFGKRIDFAKNQGIFVSDIIRRLPNEIVTVNLDYAILDNNGQKVADEKMQLWAGFVGLHQDTITLALKPEIAWFITNHESPKPIKDADSWTSIVYNNVKEFPEAILSLRVIGEITINFLGEIVVPDEISAINIPRLYLNGIISNNEIDRIKKLLPNTIIYINNVHVNKKQIWD